ARWPHRRHAERCGPFRGSGLRSGRAAPAGGARRAAPGRALAARGDRPRRTVRLLQWRPAVPVGLRGAERVMRANGITIEDTFAEAFPMKATRLVVTAHDAVWAMHAAVSATGMAT